MERSVFRGILILTRRHQIMVVIIVDIRVHGRCADDGMIADKVFHRLSCRWITDNRRAFHICCTGQVVKVVYAELTDVKERLSLIFRIQPFLRSFQRSLILLRQKDIAYMRHSFDGSIVFRHRIVGVNRRYTSALRTIRIPSAHHDEQNDRHNFPWQMTNTLLEVTEINEE